VRPATAELDKPGEGVVDSYRAGRRARTAHFRVRQERTEWRTPPPPPLIPRAVLFGNPDKANPQISPDGSRISFLADVEGVMNLWVAPADDPAAARPVTGDRGRGIQNYFWAFDNRHLLYLQDRNGDENVTCTGWTSRTAR
jgi:dipeptidyl aminopeptidase/acylaminoacyl peptidase